MSALLVSPEAEQDLLDIWLYIAADNPANADRFLDRLEETARKLAEFKHMGSERSELAEGLKSFPYERYVIFYRDAGAGVELVRVLHGARDVTAIWGQ